jgi:hypothetical protein
MRAVRIRSAACLGSSQTSALSSVSSVLTVPTIPPTGRSPSSRLLGTCLLAEGLDHRDHASPKVLLPRGPRAFRAAAALWCAPCPSPRMSSGRGGSPPRRRRCDGDGRVTRPAPTGPAPALPCAGTRYTVARIADGTGSFSIHRPHAHGSPDGGSTRLRGSHFAPARPSARRFKLDRTTSDRCSATHRTDTIGWTGSPWHARAPCRRGKPEQREASRVIPACSTDVRE